MGHESALQFRAQPSQMGRIGFAEFGGRRRCMAKTSPLSHTESAQSPAKPSAQKDCQRVTVGEMPEAGSIRLLPTTPAFLEAVLADRREEAERVLGISLFAEFPSEGERRFLAMRLRQMHEDAGFQTWCVHAVVLGGQMVGHAGYHGPPGRNAADAPDAVEFGYTIFAPYRGRGYATDAARILMDMAEKRARVRHFVLAVSPTNAPFSRDHSQARFQENRRADGRRGRP
jgi:RimJ/RimL family protein N-acetyltransferase